MRILRYHFATVYASNWLPHAQRTLAIGYHFFIPCRRVAGAWGYLLHLATILVIGSAIDNQSLLYVAWPPVPRRVEAALTLGAVCMFL